MILRKEINGILNEWVGETAAKQITKEVCAAIGKSAEGMPSELFRASPPIVGAKDGGVQYAEDIGFNKGVIKCQDYWQKEIEK